MHDYFPRFILTIRGIHSTIRHISMDDISPQKEEFLSRLNVGAIIPLAREITVPGLTPLSALEALRQDGYPALLESARVNEKIGRYSFVTADPYLIMQSRG